MVFKGDLLSHELSAPSEVIKKLKWWLKGRFKMTYKDLGDSLEHGHQNGWTDWNSERKHCGSRNL